MIKNFNLVYCRVYLRQKFYYLNCFYMMTYVHLSKRQYQFFLRCRCSYYLNTTTNNNNNCKNNNNNDNNSIN